MRWEDERYVRWYTRNTPEWCLLSWQARGLFGLIMREVDRAGILELGRVGLKAVAVAVRATWDEIEKPLQELIDDGCIVYRPEKRILLVPNFIAAQEAAASDKARQRSARERARDLARAESHGVTTASQSVTSSREQSSHAVTEGHATAVNGHSTPNRADPIHPNQPIQTPPKPPNGRAHVRADETSPEAQRPDPEPAREWPSGETGYDLVVRVWDELWSAKYRRAYVHSTHTGSKSESAAMVRIGTLAIERASASPHSAEAFIRHWVRAYLKDDEAWLSDNGHPLRALETRINKYGDPKVRKPPPPTSSPSEDPPRPVTILQPVEGAPPPKKTSAPEDLTAKAAAEKERLAQWAKENP